MRGCCCCDDDDDDDEELFRCHIDPVAEAGESRLNFFVGRALVSNAGSNRSVAPNDASLQRWCWGPAKLTAAIDVVMDFVERCDGVGVQRGAGDAPCL